MLDFKLWKAKPKKVLAAGGAYLEVYSVDSVDQQKVRLYNYLEDQSRELRKMAKRIDFEADQVLKSI